MEIEYKGANCTVIKTKNSTVIVDPTENVGVRDYGPLAIVLYTDQRFEENSKQTGFAIDMPGEFEKGEVSVRGIASRRHIDPEGKEVTIYKLELAGFRIAILGHVATPLSENDLEQIGVVDIMILPVGGNGYTLDSMEATTTVRQIGPRVVIPTHFDDGTTYEVPQEKLEVFKKEFGGAQEEKGTSVKMKNIEELAEGPVIFELKKS
jgi:L-ascorbate metabolism protein UlaG (beta-lactamase superfamily)